MTDLTERLRALKTLDVHWERLATEAADEIERLQSLLEAANEMEADREAALQEIERLRAALERIERIVLGTPDQFRQIAREALNLTDVADDQ